MIEEHYLDQAILENKANPDPDGWTLIRLAAQIYLKKELFGTPEQLSPQPPVQPALAPSRAYALAAPPQAADDLITYTSKSEFGSAIVGKRAADVWPIIDELLSITQAISPDLYKAVLAKIE